ncbi:MAG: sugar ABC transporter permease, partial [Clostridia bacterium]
MLKGNEALGVKKRKKWNSNDWTLLIMAMFGVAFLAVFAYAPMYGLILAFKNGDGYMDITAAIRNAEWNGLDNFKDFISDPDFKSIMINTLGLNILQLLINFPAPIIFAILMSELLGDKFKKAVQSITFFPHFISWVIFGGIFISILDYDTGIVNTVLHDLGIIKDKVDILGDPQ